MDVVRTVAVTARGRAVASQQEVRMSTDTGARPAATDPPPARSQGLRLPADDFMTTSGEPVQGLYTPGDLARRGIDPAADIGAPGQFPYTRGIYETMYRGKLWTMRLFAGFGSAEETNARFRYLLEQGQTGLSVAFDLPTLYGRDTDDPWSLGEFGKCGVAVSSLADMEILVYCDSWFGGGGEAVETQAARTASHRVAPAADGPAPVCTVSSGPDHASRGKTRAARRSAVPRPERATPRRKRGR
jgi:hypothetical protein